MMKSRFETWFDRVDLRIVRWLARYSMTFLRIGMGIVFASFVSLYLLFSKLYYRASFNFG
jgi:hypothetical protein